MDRLPNIHPGEVLLEEFLKPLNITPYRLAKSLGVPQTRIAGILRGRRSITPDTALRLAAFFGTTARFWLNLQADYDLEETSRSLADDLARITAHNTTQKAVA
jgi:addiction module HigA family antidote